MNIAAYKLAGHLMHIMRDLERTIVLLEPAQAYGLETARLAQANSLLSLARDNLMEARAAAQNAIQNASPQPAAVEPSSPSLEADQ